MNINQYAPLRFITAGSVDDGKSTLIGRLLYDSKTLLSDQLLNLTQSKNHNEVMDFSVLTDGLEAEREQGITIDVAYRYFSTVKRKFIIADTPGHEQYTRNMVTGASTASAAVVLLDASQLDFSQAPLSLLAQTRRHSIILKLLDCAHIILAVNKIDLLDYSQERFLQIKEAYAQFAQEIGLKQMDYVPISALHGDNIVHLSARTPWYQGPALLSILEALPSDNQVDFAPEKFHLPVQLVSRQDSDKKDDFRGYQGRIESGSVTEDQLVRVQPTGFPTRIKEIYGPNGRVKKAQAGETITLTLQNDIDISRGDAILDASSATQAYRKVQANICWFDQRSLNLSRKYELKQTTQTSLAKVKAVDYVLDIHSLDKNEDQETLALNDIGQIRLSLAKPIIATTYEENHYTGSFILIDCATHHTVAAGMITDLEE